MSRRTLMLGLIVLIVVMAMLFLLRGRGSSTPSVQPSRQTSGTTRIAAVKPNSKPAAPKPAVHKKSAPVRKAQTVVRPAAKPARLPAGLVDQHTYAVRLIPVVDKGALGFDRAVGAAASTSDLGALAGSCGQSVQRVGILQDQVEGVPHPYVWYSQAGSTHRSLLGVYHDMLGATEQCQTAAGNGDDAGARSAVHDMATAAQQLHRTDSYLHWLARQPK